MIPVPHCVFAYVESLSKAGSIPVLDCLRCQNPLTLKETKAQEHYCAPCKRLVEANEHQQALASQIHRANRVMR